MAEFCVETERLIRRHERSGDLAVWLERIDTPEVMGKIGSQQSPDKVAEALARFGLAPLFGQISESNRPSWRLMECLAMRRCAELDYPDPDCPPEHNPMVYRLDAADWRLRVAAEAHHAHV